jgi:phage terminase large subunit
MQRDYGISLFTCDPSEPEHIEVFKRAGFGAKAADNAVIPGIQEVQRRLKVKGDGKPSLFISPKCANLISELESYVWDEAKDKPVKANDHAMDALRYLCAELKAPVPEDSAQSRSLYDFQMNDY